MCFIKDVIIQVVATLIASLILYGIRKTIKQLKKIPIHMWIKYLYRFLVILTYLFNVHNIIIIVKYAIKCDSVYQYIGFIFSLAFSFYSLFGFSDIIKNDFFEK